MKPKPLDLSPRKLHNYYLEIVANLKRDSYNPKAEKPYEELTDEQKLIDKSICEKIKTEIRTAVQGLLNEVEKMPTYQIVPKYEGIKFVPKSDVKRLIKKWFQESEKSD